VESISFFIVVPTKNSDRFLLEALESVAMQTFGSSKVHLHIQDSLSTDSTIDIIRDFVSRIDCGLMSQQLSISYSSEADDGMYDAIERGLANAIRISFNPTVFFWLNSDDMLLPGAINNLATTFSDPEVQWVLGEANDIDQFGKSIFHEPHATIPIKRLHQGDFNYAGAPWLRAESTAIRFSAYREVGGFDRSFKLAGDYQLFQSLSVVAEPRYVPYGIRAFRKHEGQLSSNLIAYEHERARIKYFLHSNTISTSNHECLNVINEKLLPLYFYPDYTKGNAYQRLLYADTIATGLEDLSALENVCREQRSGAIHIHWLNQIIAVSYEQAVENVRRFRRAIDSANANGLRIVFTVHNVSSHEGANKELEESVINYLFSTASVVHVHHAVVSYQLLNRYGKLPWAKMIIAEHGPYPEPDAAATLDDLRKVDIYDLARPYIAIPGQIRSYKNLALLCELIEKLDQSESLSEDMLCVFVGSFHPAIDEATRTALSRSRNVRIASSWLDDEQFSRILKNAKYILLSYSDISTSGALFHSFSMGVPVIAPDLGTIPSYLFNGYNGYLYKSNSSDSAWAAVQSGLHRLRYDNVEYAKMQAASLESAKRLSWSRTFQNIFSKLTNCGNLV
jgi:glycosyltransferase involved in cell wall biosynthesis